MALRKRICRTFDFELQASATDDGLNFSLGPNMAFPLAEIFTYLSSKTVEEVLLQAVLQAPLFGTRWRWNASRFLALLRHSGGRRVPAPLQRMRSDDLLAAVFPAQVQCQDNAPPGNIEPPDHPLVFETVRDCLTEAMDLEGLKGVLTAIEQGKIEVLARDTVQPSVFSHQILNALPYAFLDDAPLEERRARAVSLRRALPDDARDLASLDEETIEEELANAWPRMCDADELHDALLTLGILPEAAVPEPEKSQLAGDVGQWFNQLVKAGRAFSLILSEGRRAWVAAEQLALVIKAYPEARLEPEPPAYPTLTAGLSQDEAILYLVRGWAECSGPFRPDEMAQLLSLSVSDVNIALAQLEAEGLVLRGSFRPGAVAEEFCDRRILARIHRSTIGRLRREIEPVSQSTFLRFLFRWQNVERPSRVTGEGGLLEVIEKLQGFEAAAGALESEVLASRVVDYQPTLLDRLCMGGEVVWGRLTHYPHNGYGTMVRGVPLTRGTPITLALREDLDWLLDPLQEDEEAFVGAAGELLELLSSRGACFMSEMVARTRRLPSDVEEALWTLAAAGRVTADSLEALRVRINGSQEHKYRDSRHRRSRPYRRGNFSRWSLLEPLDPELAPDTAEPRARQLLRRYGVVFPELLARERMAPPWRELVRLFRRLEARGEIRGGRFVAGFVGEQFALPEAVGLVREVNSSQPTDRMEVISACDPLNLVGILTSRERVPAVPGNRILFRNGVPLASLEKGTIVPRARGMETDIDQTYSLLFRPFQGWGNNQDEVPGAVASL
jgi:ATP-dependent Lhr-like helicase